MSWRDDEFRGSSNYVYGVPEALFSGLSEERRRELRSQHERAGLGRLDNPGNLGGSAHFDRDRSVSYRPRMFNNSSRQLQQQQRHTLDDSAPSLRDGIANLRVSDSAPGALSEVASSSTASLPATSFKSRPAPPPPVVLKEAEKKQEPSAPPEEQEKQDDTNEPEPLVELHACGICYGLYDERVNVPKILHCGHTYCAVCLRSLARTSSLTCPVCRKHTNVSYKNLSSNFQLLQVLAKLRMMEKRECVEEVAAEIAGDGEDEEEREEELSGPLDVQNQLSRVQQLRDRMLSDLTRTNFSTHQQRRVRVWLDQLESMADRMTDLELTFFDMKLRSVHIRREYHNLMTHLDDEESRQEERWASASDGASTDGLRLEDVLQHIMHGRSEFDHIVADDDPDLYMNPWRDSQDSLDWYDQLGFGGEESLVDEDDYDDVLNGVFQMVHRDGQARHMCTVCDVQVGQNFTVMRQHVRGHRHQQCRRAAEEGVPPPPPPRAGRGGRGRRGRGRGRGAAGGGAAAHPNNRYAFQHRDRPQGDHSYWG